MPSLLGEAGVIDDPSFDRPVALHLWQYQFAYLGDNNLVAKYLKDTFKNLASYDAFAISAFRWVDSFKGWIWMTCVRFEENGHPRTYAAFIKDGKVIDSRYAVQIDACNTQTYAAFDAMGRTPAGVLGPLY